MPFHHLFVLPTNVMRWTFDWVEYKHISFIYSMGALTAQMETEQVR